jgi:hypothetical protein
VAKDLRHEVQERLAKAGVEVIEARLSHLAYASGPQPMAQRRKAPIRHHHPRHDSGPPAVERDRTVQAAEGTPAKQLAAQLAVLVNGAFVSSGLLGAEEATGVLRTALTALLAGARR